MNPNFNPEQKIDAFAAGGIGRPTLSDDDLYFYARRHFDLVDPDLVELELARDPVARRRLLQIQDQIRGHREARILESMETRDVTALEAATAAPEPSIHPPSLTDWLAHKGIRVGLRIRRLADSVTSLEIGEDWRLVPGGNAAVLGAKAAAPAPGQASPRKWFQIRDRWHNHITVSHSPQGCRIEVLLLLWAAPKGTATLQLAQPVHPDTQQAGPTRTALVHRNSAVFENCPAGLYQLTGVEGLDVWILIEPD